MHFGAIANSARGGPPRPPPVRDRVKLKRKPCPPKFMDIVYTP